LAILIFGIAAMGLVLVYEWYENHFPSVTYRYRMTVFVDTPAGLKTGFSVQEASASTSDIELLPGMTNYQASQRGEAVAVDIAPNQTLFVLLDGSGGSAEGTLQPEKPFDGYQAVNYRRNFEALKATKGAAVMPKALYPRMVRFRDIRDPKTVELVDPAHLEASFGKGVKLKSITVEVTDDAMTTGIGQRLWWIGNVYQYLDSSFHPHGIPVGDFRGLFTTEIHRES